MEIGGGDFIQVRDIPTRLTPPNPKSQIKPDLNILLEEKYNQYKEWETKPNPFEEESGNRHDQPYSVD